MKGKKQKHQICEWSFRARKQCHAIRKYLKSIRNIKCKMMGYKAILAMEWNGIPDEFSFKMNLCTPIRNWKRHCSILSNKAKSSHVIIGSYTSLGQWMHICFVQEPVLKKWANSENQNHLQSLLIKSHAS